MDPRVPRKKKKKKKKAIKTMDLTFVLSAVIFTLLALVVATSLLNGSSRSSSSSSAGSYTPAGPSADADTGGESAVKENGHMPDIKQGKEARDDWCELSGSSHDHWDVVKSVLSTDGEAESPETNDKSELKYVPGKSRSHHMEMMMSKEELEEEQRVQREQLAAIFQLLKDNTETFGDVSEGDMEEQLRLYSI
ncbi:matrix-remodeling-associated protein 7-like isoform X2 [Phyllopteryx taeniolatus]|uniref:matrix-remodeling-associated protein 7-like isoform X2 n=1 Tax=Phyllopteryx taeniolatus TaxID=161469 RepID=UPI002AD352DF|nr:matrix-remodeling-associated protein 7-like isoform X2 [Phyllopteryx taeniolatus]